MLYILFCFKSWNSQMNFTLDNAPQFKLAMFKCLGAGCAPCLRLQGKS